MLLRALILAAVTLTSSEGQALAPRPRWQVAVAPPRAALPAVTVEFGYAGPYIPPQNAPITLRARAGYAAFDGYIGFHLRTESGSRDNQVIARAILRPHEQWTFSTFATRPRGGRESDLDRRQLGVEWRDASMKIRGEQLAGTPPWAMQLMPLRITAAEGAALSDRAQWYAGFSEVIAPLDVWVDLPRRIREAIFGSAVHIVLFGLPRSEQRLDDIDRAALPITFIPRPGSYQVPWPYGKSETVSVPSSWSVKRGAREIGNGPLPYMVRAGLTTWVADATGASQPLPVTDGTPIALHNARSRRYLPDPKFQAAVGWPRPAELGRVYSGLLLVLFAALLSLAGWLCVRRQPRAVLMIVLVIGAIFVFAARSRVRSPGSVYQREVEVPLAPGVIGSLQFSRVYGASPLPAESHDTEAMRTRVSGGHQSWEDLEVRTSATPVAMGVVRRSQDWDAITRWSWKRQPGNAPHVRIRRRELDKLELDYESRIPVHYVYAEWLCGEKLCWGETAVRPATRGTAIVRSGHELWPEPEPFLNEIREFPFPVDRSLTRVSLIHKTRAKTHVLRWFDEPASEPGSFFIADVKTLQNGAASFAFAIPPGVSKNADGVVSVNMSGRPSRVTLVRPGRTTELTPVSGKPYAIPPEALKEILATGGIVHVSVVSGEPGPLKHPFVSTVIRIREKKP